MVEMVSSQSFNQPAITIHLFVCVYHTAQAHNALYANNRTDGDYAWWLWFAIILCMLPFLFVWHLSAHMRCNQMFLTQGTNIYVTQEALISLKTLKDRRLRCAHGFDRPHQLKFAPRMVLRRNFCETEGKQKESSCLCRLNLLPIVLTKNKHHFIFRSFHHHHVNARRKRRPKQQAI